MLVCLWLVVGLSLARCWFVFVSLLVCLWRPTPEYFSCPRPDLPSSIIYASSIPTLPTVCLGRLLAPLSAVRLMRLPGLRPMVGSQRQMARDQCMGVVVTAAVGIPGQAERCVPAYVRWWAVILCDFVDDAINPKAV